MRYYYLLTALPELLFEEGKLPINREEFERLTEENLSPDDKELFNLLKFGTDNQNVVNLLEGSNQFLKGGVFSREELEEGIRHREGLPEYLLVFLSRREEKSNRLIEDQLWELYLDCSAKKNYFLKEYFLRERNLRNFISAVNLRKEGRKDSRKLIGSEDEEIYTALTNSNLPDFGLSKELPYAPAVSEFITNDRYLELERYTDRLRFETINELNRFNYFTVEQILGYSLKLEIMERWHNLSEEKGQHRLDELTS